jgi:hypothetical protein
MANKTPAPPSETPDRRALLQAYQDVVRSEKEKRGHPALSEGPPGPRYHVLIPLLLMLAGLSAALVLRPAWLFTPPLVESPAIRDATLRVLMYLQIDRIERFRAAKGRLPASLDEAGGDTTAVHYAPGTSGYLLTGNAKGGTLTYDSRIPPKVFLGNSYHLIQNRGRP